MKNHIWILTSRTDGGHTPKAFTTREALEEWLNSREFSRSREYSTEIHLLDAGGRYWTAHKVQAS